MKALSVVWKDLQILFRDPGDVVLTFLLPFVFILVFSIPNTVNANTAPSGITVTVVDQDGTSASQELVDRLNKAGGITVRLSDLSVAQAQMQADKLGWYLVIPPDLHLAALDRTVTLRLVVHPDADKTRAESLLRVVSGAASDMALESQLVAAFQQLGDMMKGAPSDYQKAFNPEVYIAQAKSQFEHSKAQPLVDVEQVIPAREKTGLEFGSANTLVPGVAILFVFLAAQASAMSVFVEKKTGSFRRLLAAPISRTSLLLGKMAPTFIITLMQIFIIFVVAILVLPLLGVERLTLGTDPVAVVLVSILAALCATGLSAMIAAIAHTESQAGAISQVVLWVLAVVGGCFFPTFLLSGPLKALSAVAPHSWALRAYTGLFVYGKGLPDILPEMGVLLGFTVVFFAIGLWQFDFD
jgi:ABC-2 type transport system permease protein